MQLHTVQFRQFFFFSLGFRLQIHCCETKVGRQVLAATSARLLDWSALNFNIGFLCTTSCRSRTHSFFNLGSHGHERLFYICGILCTGFQKRNSKRICKFLQIKKQWTVSSYTGSYLTLFYGGPLDYPQVPGSHPTPHLQSEDDLQGRGSLNCPHLWYKDTSLHWNLWAWQTRAGAQPSKHRSPNIPLLLYSLLLSLWSDHTCSPPTTCWHFHWHNGLSPAATAWHYWKTPMREENCKQGPR